MPLLVFFPRLWNVPFPAHGREVAGGGVSYVFLTSSAASILVSVSSCALRAVCLGRWRGRSHKDVPGFPLSGSSDMDLGIAGNGVLQVRVSPKSANFRREGDPGGRSARALQEPSLFPGWAQKRKWEGANQEA